LEACVNLHGINATLFAAGAVIGCKDPAATGDRLDGTWEWVNSCGGVSGGCITPSFAGYTLHLRIKTVSTLGIMEYYRSGSRVLVSVFRLTGEDIEGERQILMLEKQATGTEFVQESQHIVTFDGDDLILTQNFPDGYASRYTHGSIPTP
jgi:hypothetical protein